MKKQTWTKESNDCYTQGNYYKENLSVFVRQRRQHILYYEIVLRNTWTGETEILDTYSTKTEAIKNLRKYTLENPIYN